MSKLPLEASEVQVYTPESLKNIPDAPSFRFRAVTERHRRQYNNLCIDEGLEQFDDAEFHAERKIAVALLWNPEDAQPMIARLETIYQSEKQKIPVSDEDREWFSALDEKLFEHHRRLNVMTRKNKDFFEYATRFAVSTFVIGWKGIDLPFRLDAGYLPVEDVPLIAKKLQKIEEQAIADNIEGVGFPSGGKRVPGLAYFELYTEAVAQLRLGEDEEKNSPAPSQSSSSQEDSTTAPSESGASTEASSSDEKSSSSSSTANEPRKNSDAASSGEIPKT